MLHPAPGNLLARTATPALMLVSCLFQFFGEGFSEWSAYFALDALLGRRRGRCGQPALPLQSGRRWWPPPAAFWCRTSVRRASAASPTSISSSWGESCPKFCVRGGGVRSGFPLRERPVAASLSPPFWRLFWCLPGRTWALAYGASWWVCPCQTGSSCGRSAKAPAA